MSETTHLVLRAPLSGIVVPLDVPDPVFAQRMVGDGVSIDPYNLTRRAVRRCTSSRFIRRGTPSRWRRTTASKCSCTLASTRCSSKAAVSLRVKTGDVVRAGDVLIDFDADYVATHARSLMTEVIITSTDRIAALQPASGSVKAGRTRF